jgi:hypothetical protein
LEYSFGVNEQTATRVAFGVAPAVPSLIGAALTPVTPDFGVKSILVFAVIFYVIAAAVTAGIGAPIFFWLRRRNLVKWWSALLVGFLIGVAAASFLRLQNLHYMPGVELLHDMLLLGLVGAISACVFWIIWKSGCILDRKDA